MENRVTNGPARIATAPPANNAVAAPRIAAPEAVAAVNTVDATAFASRPAMPTDLAEIQAVLTELQDRIAALESRVAELQGEDPAAPANLGPANAPAMNNAPANAANAPAANVALPPGVNLPPLPVGNSAANAPANNYATDDDVPLGNDAPAANAVVATDDQAPSAAAQEVEALRAELGDMQAQLRDTMGRVDAALANRPAADAAAQREVLTGQMKGLEGVAYVLDGAKLSNLTPQEEHVVTRALGRVHEIGRAIARGEEPGQYAAELFALKHTLADPAGAGRHPAVTTGAQTIQYIEEQKADLTKKIKANERKLAKKADPALTRENAALNARIKGLVGIQKALGGAALTGLTPAAERTAGANVDRLGALTEAIATGAADPTRVEGEIFRLAQALQKPGTNPAAVVDAGADVVGRIAKGKEAIRNRLREIDDRIMAGDAPEAYAAERAKLLNNAEALEELGDAVKGARLDKGNAKERREVSFGLAKAGAMADAIGSGNSDASRLRGEIFVLKQTFQEPLASKENPAIQAGAAALGLIGKAEQDIQKQREAVASGATRGQDMRQYDAAVAGLARKAEDLEAMRKGITGADFGGLTPEQEARGAELIDQMNAIALKVAGGEDFSRHQRAYKALAAQLADLRHWRGGWG